MGVHFLDQYSLLHFATGVVGYFWGIPLAWWFVINVLFEVIENSSFGMNLINNISVWPGGKTFADYPINIVGDLVTAMLGWIAAYCLDTLIKKYMPLPKHLQ